jgi:hypothetical protein
MEVSTHTQSCAACRTLRVIERESRLLTRAMLEDEEPLPSRIAVFQEKVQRSMQWIWMVVFGLAATQFMPLTPVTSSPGNSASNKPDLEEPVC